MQIPLFIQCVLTESIKMSPGSLLEGGVLGRARSLPHYSSLTPVFSMAMWPVLWLVGLDWVGKLRDGEALSYCLFVALPSQCMTSGVES